MWESDYAKSYYSLNPILDEVLVITMIPLTEDPEKGIISGLYNNIIGKGLYYESSLIWLDKCIDQDRDGIDDDTGEPALTYGNSTDQYFNTCLMIKFKIFSIQKNLEYQWHLLSLVSYFQMILRFMTARYPNPLLISSDTLWIF